MTSLFVPGVPIAQPRPRRGKHGNFYSNSPASAAWKRQVTLAVKQGVGKLAFEGPVFLWLSFVLPLRSHPKRLLGRPHVVKPDLSNFVKLVEDALTDAGAWTDDAQVASLQASKRYGIEPGVHIAMAEIGDPAVDEIAGGIAG